MADFKQNNFMNPNFYWFTGVVEDIQDPMEMGRVRVRCFGYHTENISADAGIPTSALPWGHVMMPITSASCSGIGESATGVLPGSWVVGFFRDGAACQDPLILGTVPARTPAPADTKTGFCDPTAENPREDSAIDNPKGSYGDYFLSHAYEAKEKLRQTTKPYPDKEDLVPTAVPPKTDILSSNQPDDFFERGEWIQPDQENITEPSYPNCHTKEYKSGHTVEFDDTNGKERILILHSSGTFDETDYTGSKTSVIVGDGYEVTFKNKNVHVKGHCNLTVDGDVRTYVRGNYFMEVEKDYHLNVKGNIHKKVGGNKADGGGSEYIEISNDRLDNIGLKLSTTIGANEKRLVTEDSELEIKGNSNIMIAGDLTNLVTGNEVKSTIGTYSATGGGGMSMVGTGKVFLNSSDDIVISALGTGKKVDINGTEIHLN